VRRAVGVFFKQDLIRRAKALVGVLADGVSPQQVGAGTRKEVRSVAEAFEIEAFRPDAFMEGFDIGLVVFLAHPR